MGCSRIHHGVFNVEVCVKRWVKDNSSIFTHSSLACPAGSCAKILQFGAPGEKIAIILYTYHFICFTLLSPEEMRLT